MMCQPVTLISYIHTYQVKTSWRERLSLRLRYWKLRGRTPERSEARHPTVTMCAHAGLSYYSPNTPFVLVSCCLILQLFRGSDPHWRGAGPIRDCSLSEVSHRGCRSSLDTPAEAVSSDLRCFSCCLSGRGVVGNV